MKKVIIESPYAGDIERNIQYTKLCMKDCLERGEAPIASHLLYTQQGILNDDIPEERQQGIDSGLARISVADKQVIYMDYGISKGMYYGIRKGILAGINQEMRFIF